MAKERPRRPAPLSWLQPAVLTGSLAPFVVIALRAGTGRLGANPVETTLNQLGLLALTFLVACLACTPARVVLRMNWPMRVRKTLGLFAFFTALAHFLVYAVLDQSLALSRIFRDVGRHPFVAVGFAALLLLVPLALTSTRRSMTTLGFARWKRLHRLVYVVAGLAVVHFVMRVKADVREPYVWAAIVAALLAVRVVNAARGAPRGRRANPVAAS